ncbi:retinoblastoma-like protein 2 [Notolabrus celidotus]|uniref:retinoblastoma-like protein 2 n=1 Tax=Notolabrus celidotus TaxID=1203425 RepID=UPI00148F77CA|nr:retinoblastoma-like protein 2 [Notolabrus celidotus]XP_034536210.1 retinoblastoma-like protein 2 [Notolabrus celidotus]
MLAERHLTKRFPTLGISDELRVKIWTCFEHSLVNFPHLMEDRHLDQLLMCAIFIIAKAINEEIPFKHIVRCYKSQPHISKSVCKDVLISGGSEEDSLSGNNNNEDQCAGIPTPDTPSAHYPAPREEQRGNLFKFFNNVYSPRMSDFANQFAAPVGVGSPPLTPYPMQNRTTLRQLHRDYNIFISPLDRGMTPQETSGPTYTFNSGSSEPLREINDMGSGSVPVRRARVALSMEGEEGEEGDDGPPRRRRRSSNQSALFRRLRDVENDRAGPQPDLLSSREEREV